MLKRLMANVELFGTTRAAFRAREAFNVHPTTKHTEQDPFPDQIKAMQFILRKKFLKPDIGRNTVEKFNGKGAISSSNVDAYAAGKKKVQDNFNRKFYSIYGKMNEDEGGDLD